ncbi:MAG: hypothetical protein RBS57_11145 [Desulforhabdus sp.]|nr:hypothetical protein [Desulforhabdus sp.]
MSSNDTTIIRKSIREKIRIAHELLATLGDSLRGDRRISELLADLQMKTAASRQAMFDLGIVSICRFCEDEDGGSCCGRGIEDKYDPVLLLTNLLLGIRLPEHRFQTDSCYFLGREGCCLEARDVICVNYLCRKLQTVIPPHDLIRLQTLNGEELDAAFALTEAIKKFICHESRCKSPG